MVKVSVITPFYQGNQYIENLFAMITKNQLNLQKVASNEEIELIIVNDSPNIKVILPQDIKIKYQVIDHEQNKGIHQARVTGINHCQGDIILFLDQDDEIDDNFIIKQLNILKNHDVVVCNALLEQKDQSTILLYKNKFEFSKVLALAPYLKSHNQIASPGQCLIKKEIIPDEWQTMIMNNNGSDDLFLWLLLLKKNCSFVLNLEALYIHKYTGSNLSQEADKMGRSSLSMVDYLKKSNMFTTKELDTFSRARNFDIQFMQAGLGKKIVLLIKNLDLFLSRAVWKIRSYVSK